MKLRPYQLHGHDLLRAAYRAGKRRILYVMPCGCHRKGQRILLADGRSITVEDVRVGDQLMGPGGDPRTVLALARGFGRMATITPKKGEPFTVNEDHVLTLYRQKDHGVSGKVLVDIRLGDFDKWAPSRKSIHYLQRSGAEFGGLPNRVDFFREIDPYFLGVIVGDGSLKSIGIATTDPEIEAECYREADRWGLSVREDKTQGKCPMYFLAGPRGGINPLRRALESFGLHKNVKCGDKFIPDAYRLADRRTRLEVLAGLIDTDGSLAKSGFDFISKSKRLATDVVFLARSVGLAAYRMECRKSCQTGAVGTYHRVSVTGDCDMVPCRIKRKKAPPRRQIKNVLRVGFKYQWLSDPEDFYGFTLDGDGRYLLEDFTITHNSGKTVSACHVIDGAIKRGHRCLFVVDQRMLVNQAHARLASYGIKAGVIMGNRPRTSEPVQVASVQTLARREHEPWDIVIVDEGHHATSPTYRALLPRYPCIIGLTATPFRMGGKGLGDVFDALVEPVTTSELVAQGVLIAPTVYSHPNVPDVSSLRVKKGDYQIEQLAEAADQPRLLGDIVEHWQARAAGRRTIVAATRIEHSKHIAEAFLKAGIPAEHIDGTVADRGALERLESGETLVLCQVSLLGEGFDLPALEVAVCARPTASLRWWIQFQGRVMRAAPGKEGCTILDHAGNARVHGLVTAKREHTLEGVVSAKVASLRTCPVCWVVCSPGVSVCPECGAELARERKAGAAVPEVVDGQLVEFRGMSQAERLEWYAGIVAIASEKEYRLGWARNQYREHFGVWPRKVKEIENEYRCAQYEARSSQWRDFCGRCFRGAKEHQGVGV